MVFLAMSYVQADGRSGCFLAGRSVTEALGWDEPTFITVHTYLQACAAFDHQGIGGMFSLSTCALDRIEGFLQDLVAVPTAQTVADLLPHVEEPLLDLARQQALAVEATVERTTQLHMRLLQAAVDRFRAETGQLPSALTELTKTGPMAPFGGYLCEVPDHPSGGGYELDPATGQVHETGQKDDAS
jgi:hypothetical protein